MALCTKCRVDVGCACNLIPKYDIENGVCNTCHEISIKAQEALNQTNNASVSPSGNTQRSN